ncbi:hypothetical protein WKI13_00695 [Teredinibacter turnerae]|uniref:hypothetical protein n=1 Tax=Teredinibacter turnerae TaxID=2426 RepID=UPI000369BE60|nr:hypothetical protein [Teredinibacter turnerae]
MKPPIIFVFIFLFLVTACESKEDKVSIAFAEMRKLEEFKMAVAEKQAQMEREYQVKEEAVWFGKTGLSEQTERELPRYLRRELGESLFNEGSLKANDLLYLGLFLNEPGNGVHYWKVPWSEKNVYATVEIYPNGSEYMSWGQEELPKERLKP